MNVDVTDGAVADAARGMFRRMDDRLRDGGDRPLANLPGGPLTYAETGAAIPRLLHGFGRIGLGTGDRALIVSHDDRTVITLFLAMLRCGITPVIADPRTTDAEGAELARFCRVRAVFGDRIMPRPIGVAMVLAGGGAEASASGGGVLTLAALTDGAGPAALPDAGAGGPEVALLVLTSGTTSAPKAVELTHANLAAQMDIFAEVYGFDADSRLLNLLPLHHVDGLIRGPLAALWTGGTVERRQVFSVAAIPEILGSVARHGVTHLISVPAMLRMIERVGQDQPDAFRTPAFRFVLSSADLLDAALWRRFEDRFGVPLANAYGLSEVVCDALFAGPQAATRRIGTIGRPVGCTAQVLDASGAPVPPGTTGELVLSGPTVMRGYFEAGAETAAVLKAGAFHTGDYVRQDDDGLFVFVGRKKTAIVSAGATIHPEAAAQVIAAMPGVAEAVAFGVPDPAMGERLVAAVVPDPGVGLTADEVMAYCRTALSPERVPREIRMLQALPRNAAGKVQIADLLAGDALAGARPDAPPDVIAVAARCFNLPPAALTLDSSPFNTPGWDSLAHMTLIEALEAAFGIEFSAMQIAQIMSLGDASACVDEALGRT